jgi:hypothetical protein
MTRNTQFTVIGVTLASLALGVSGCASAPKVSQSAEEQSSVSPAISGKVVETMDAAGYTYICLEKDGKKTWAALPATKVAVGDEIKILGGAIMPGFTSKALNRSFDKIIFSGGLDQGKAAAPAPGAKQDPAAPAKPAEPPVLAGKVIETMRAASYTYVLLEKDGKRGWAAVPATEVKVGDEIELIPGVDMGTFKSTTLKRTFDAIHFSAGIKGAREKKVAAQKAAADAAAAAGAKAPVAGAKAPAAGTAAPAAGSPLPDGHPKLDAASTPAAGAPLPDGHPKLDAPTAGAPLPEGHPKLDAAMAPPAPAAEAPMLTGKVVETMEAGGYTYICLEKDKVKTWAAVPLTRVSVGEELTLAPGNVMHNFNSKSLNRTFDNIIFTNRP